MADAGGDGSLTVVLAEDHYLVREGTRRLLEDGGVRVLAAVGTAAALLDAVDERGPDAVITDIRMPPDHHMEGIAAARAIRARHPGVGVLVLSQHADEAYAFELLRDGTDGLAYLLKERVGELDQLIHALREVVAGRSVIDPLVVEAIVARQARRRQSPIQRLTPRERDVLSEMAQGKSNAAIAADLCLSASAIEKHVNKIFSELGLTGETNLNRRVAAVLAYLREGDPVDGPT
jgi:DNA-binding NarL/FixJ family response regulator